MNTQNNLAATGMPSWMKTKRIINILFLSFLPIFGVCNQEIFWRFGIYLYKEQYAMVAVGVVQFLVYMNYPASGRAVGEYRPKLYEIVMGVIGLYGGLYCAFNWNYVFITGTLGGTFLEGVLGWVFIVVVLESARRLVGWPLVGTAIFFLLYALYGNHMPGLLRSAKFSADHVAGYVYLSGVGIFGSAAQIIAIVVLAFTIFGVLLQMTKAGEFFLNIALALVGSMRGGAAKVPIFTSFLFATMTGEPASNLGIVAPLSYPIMKKLNYEPVFSGATLAVSSCGALITPPVMGAVVFLMGEMTGLGYPRIMLGAIIPAILFYFSVFMQVDFYCAGQNYPRLDKKDLPDLKETLKSGWYFLIPVAVIVYFLLWLKMSVASAVYRAIAVQIIISVIKKEDREIFFANLKNVLPDSGRGLLSVLGVTSCSGIILAVLNLTGLGLRVSALLTTISGGNLLILALITAVAIYIMGMGVAPIVSYIIMSILVAPALIRMGVSVIAAHFFIIYMATSAFITPPVAMASYIAGNIVGKSGITVGFRAMRLGIICYLVPFISLWSPTLLLEGNAFDIVHTTITALIAVVYLAAGFEGFMFIKAPHWQRVLFTIGGFLLFSPSLTTSLIGAALGVAPLIAQYQNYKKQRSR